MAPGAKAKPSKATPTQESQNDDLLDLPFPSFSGRVPAKPRKVVVSRRVWTEYENRAVLKYLLDVIQDGKTIEKPNATVFYQVAINSLKIPNCTDVQLKNQVRNLKTKYGKALEWRNKTGQGILEESGEESVQGMVFEALDHYFHHGLTFKYHF